MFVRKYNIPVYYDFFYESRICEAYFYVCDLNFLHFHKEKVVFLFFGLRNIRISTERYVMTHYHVYR